jgi:hypothetical protein
MHSTLPGINVQAPWARWIIEGAKTVETRFYPLPKKYVNREMVLIETPGRHGKFKARPIGIVIFGECFLYKSKKDFYADSKRHLVEPSTELLGWSGKNGKKKWGWPIVSFRERHWELPETTNRGIIYSTAIPLCV